MSSGYFCPEDRKAKVVKTKIDIKQNYVLKRLNYQLGYC